MTYETDFYAWAKEQAGLIRAGRQAEADWDHIAEEMDSLARTEKRELVNRLIVLLMHLLKWRFQPAHRSSSWRLTIMEQRRALADHLHDNPSLKSVLPDAIASAYARSRLRAARETGLSEHSFPATCPWPFEQIIDDGFWPEE